MFQASNARLLLAVFLSSVAHLAGAQTPGAGQTQVVPTPFFCAQPQSPIDRGICEDKALWVLYDAIQWEMEDALEQLSEAAKDQPMTTLKERYAAWEAGLFSQCTEGPQLGGCLRSQFTTFSREIALLMRNQGLQSVSERSRAKEESLKAKVEQVQKEAQEALEAEKKKLQEQAQKDAEAAAQALQAERAKLYGFVGLAFLVIAAGAFWYVRSVRKQAGGSTSPAHPLEAKVPTPRVLEPASVMLPDTTKPAEIRPAMAAKVQEPAAAEKPAPAATEPATPAAAGAPATTPAPKKRIGFVGATVLTVFGLAILNSCQKLSEMEKQNRQVPAAQSQVSAPPPVRRVMSQAEAENLTAQDVIRQVGSTPGRCSGIARLLEVEWTRYQQGYPQFKNNFYAMLSQAERFGCI